MSFKETTVQLRVSNHEKDILAQAATLLCTSLSNFVLTNAYQAAQKILTDRVHFRLSQEQWDNFCQALDEPARDIPTLKSLLTDPDPLDD